MCKKDLSKLLLLAYTDAIISLLVCASAWFQGEGSGCARRAGGVSQLGTHLRREY